MKYPIRFESLKKSDEFYSEVVELQNDAASYLKGFKWCDKIINCDVYLNMGLTLCIFLYEIENNASKDDNILWVVAGDLPPLYLDTHGAKTTKEVLEDYVKLAKDWISNVNKGRSIDDCYPFNAKPTIEMANLLTIRATFIQDVLIRNIDDIPLKVSLS
ncbi:MAG: DUF4826 family protein [Bacteroidetes bacterium]|nr:DUF4826 family protein [Bacteroidota bacterium]